jgi:hypothetical protein
MPPETLLSSSSLSARMSPVVIVLVIVVLLADLTRRLFDDATTMQDRAGAVRDVTHVRALFNDPRHKMEPAEAEAQQAISRRQPC